jgi:hypothetical protein
LLELQGSFAGRLTFSGFYVSQCLQLICIGLSFVLHGPG